MKRKNSKSTAVANTEKPSTAVAVVITPNSLLAGLKAVSDERGDGVSVLEDESLPEIFKNARIIDIAFNPMPDWSEPGQYAYGLYVNKRVEVGPNNANVYEFKAPLKNGKSFAWATWGCWSIDYIMQSASPGDLVCLMYIGEKSTGRKDPMKIFKGQVVDADFVQDHLDKLHQ